MATALIIGGPFGEKLIKKYTGEGDIEFTNYMPRSKTGTRDLEIKAAYDDGTRKIIVLRDYGASIKGKEVTVKHFETKKNAMLKFIDCTAKKTFHWSFWRTFRYQSAFSIDNYQKI